MNTQAASVKPGHLPHRIALEWQPGPEDRDRNSLNEPVDGWAAWLDNIAARVEEGTGRELLRAQQTSEELTHQVTIRWRPGVTSTDRVNWQGRILNIDSTSNPDGFKIWLVLLCKELRR